MMTDRQSISVQATLFLHYFSMIINSYEYRKNYGIHIIFIVLKSTSFILKN